MTTLYIAIGGGVALIPTYLGVTAGWHRLVDFHDRHTDRPSQKAIQPSRQPIAAITAEPHQPDDEPEDGRHYRRNIEPVDPWHRLSPAGYQYATGTPQQVPAGVDHATGVLDPSQVLATAGGHR